MLRNEEAEHREKFRDRPLLSCFPQTLGYYFEKIHESIGDVTLGGSGKMHVDLVQETIDAFMEGIVERGLLESKGWIEMYLDELSYPVEQLGLYFTSPGQADVNNHSAPIFLFYVEEKVKHLRTIAKDIDEEYAEDP